MVRSLSVIKWRTQPRTLTTSKYNHDRLLSLFSLRRCHTQHPSCIYAIRPFLRTSSHTKETIPTHYTKASFIVIGQPHRQHPMKALHHTVGITVWLRNCSLRAAPSAKRQGGNLSSSSFNSTVNIPWRLPKSRPVGKATGRESC